jgi:small redox-active disulfide protein 2
VLLLPDWKGVIIMSLFGKKKEEPKKNECCCGGDCGEPREEPQKGGCCCGGACDSETMEKAEAAKTAGASVKVLGTGCAKCNALEAAAKEALTELGMDPAIDHVTDFSEIAAYGVMTTPALVVDGRVVSFGKVLKKDEVKTILQKLRG